MVIYDINNHNAEQSLVYTIELFNSSSNLLFNFFPKLSVHFFLLSKLTQVIVFLNTSIVFSQPMPLE